MEDQEQQQRRSRKRASNLSHTSGRKRERSRTRRSRKVSRKESKTRSDVDVASPLVEESSIISLTPNAVEALSTRASILSDNNDDDDEKKKKSEQLVVRIRVDKSTTATRSDHEELALLATLSDGKHSMKVMMLNPSGSLTPRLEEGGKDWIVSIHGYVTTEGQNPKYQLLPVVCLTSFAILSTKKSGNFDLGTPFPQPTAQQTSRVRAGTIGSFLAERAPFLTNDELAGSACISENLLQDSSSSSSSTTTTAASDALIPNHKDNVQKAGDFLARHHAMITLQTSSSSTAAPPESPAKRPTEHAVQNYTNSLKEFSASQLDRQKASLGTNAGREAADRASLIAEQHNAALEMALQESSPLSPALLCIWHAVLLTGLHPDAGKIRTKTVRAGHTVFAPPDRIRPELDMFCQALQSLQKRLDMGNAMHVILFAAVAMYGVVDIHPFQDGNGRLSRIVANWALRQLLFPINLFATPAQRAEYVLALEKTRHVLSLTDTQGTVSRDDVLQAIRHTGVFVSLVQLLMDRVARAFVECNRVWEEKSGMAAEAAEARAARRARERAAQGTCIICLDEKPNIATLCCGKAVHLNCIAEWLSGSNSCPVCRSELPSISGRVARAAGRRESDNDEDEERRDHRRNQVENARDVLVNLLSSFGSGTTTTTDDSETSDGVVNDGGQEDGDATTAATDDEEDEQVGQNQNQASSNFDQGIVVDDTTTTSSDSEDNNFIESAYSLIMRNRNETVDPDPPTTTDSEDNNPGRFFFGNEPASTDDDEDAANENDDTTTTNIGGHAQEAAQQPALQHCDALYCRNRPAVDCSNHLCGRCCVLGGQYHCSRHNS